jgi:hypothetical protein
MLFRSYALGVLWVVTIASTFPAGALGATPPTIPAGVTERTFAVPLDGLSVKLPDESATLSVRAFDGGWTEWRTLAVENEQDPLLRESNLVLFPHAVTRVQVRGAVADTDMHPVRVSDAPIKYQVASTGIVTTPRILSRAEWGADESLRLRNSPAPASSSTAPSDISGSRGDTAPTGRQQDCIDAVNNYPQEFKASAPVTTDSQGRPLLWPIQYSPSVKLIAVHHTADQVTGDPRPGVERMRAIYQYHAKNRGWGDIGYQYVIDETGQIYEGRAGGDFVVGGHAYCNNVGTIGVAMMGNFDVETAPQAQVHSLQWLLQNLEQKYHIDPVRNVELHGKSLPPIVGHRQLVSTACPGLNLWQVLDQIRKNVATGNVNADVVYPGLVLPGWLGGPPTDPTLYAPAASSSSSSSQETQKLGFTALGDTTIEARPGSQVIIPFLYRGAQTVQKGGNIGKISRSNPQLEISQEQGGGYARVRTVLTAPQTIGANQSTVLHLKVQLPGSRGSYSLKIGTVSYVLEVSGLRVRGNALISTPTVSAQTYTPAPAQSSSAQASSVAPSMPTPVQTAGTGHPIRIRLHDSPNVSSDTITLRLSTAPTLNGRRISGTDFTLRRQGNDCTVESDGSAISTGIVRLDPGDGLTTVTSWQRNGRTRFRGLIECRVVDGALTLIDELPLEQYLQGLAEEPDSEPYEKQRAFAVAARTYAAYYLDAAHRKFPGKPYDGSDLPSEFQVYGGVDFESGNPQWLRVVASTANEVLTVNGQLIKPPYFSSDDGRTRDPSEAGWNDYPFASVFARKPDPWCEGMPLRGHGVGMSGCGAKGQANEGKTAEQILQYYYPGTVVTERW